MTAHPSHPAPASPLLRVARTSTVDLIVAELRKAIFTGALPVGSAIGEVEMSAQLGVSRSPLRESTQRLVQEGLLTASPGRGMRVNVIDKGQVADLYVARLAIEGQAARVIAAGAAAPVLTALEQSYDALVTASEAADARTIGDADIEFHRLLVDSAGSPRLSHYMSTLLIETRMASFSSPDGYSVRRSVSPTYRQLLDALARSDAAAAFAALERQFAEAVARLTGEDESIETVETAPDDAPPALGPIELVEPS